MEEGGGVGIVVVLTRGESFSTIVIVAKDDREVTHVSECNIQP